MAAKIMPIQNPADVLDYDFLYDLWMPSGDSILSATLTIEGPDTTMLVTASAFTATKVKAWVSGGTADLDYRVDCAITTAQGRTALRKVIIPVRNE